MTVANADAGDESKPHGGSRPGAAWGPQFHFGYINLQEWEPLVHDAFLLEMEAWDPFLQWQQHQPIWSWEQLIERHAPPTEEAINWEQLLEGHPLFPATAPWKQADDIIILQGADIVF